MLPEAQLQDVALPGEEVIIDAETPHNVQVVIHNLVGHLLGQFGYLIIPLFDEVEDLLLFCLQGWILVIELVDLGVEIPAEAVEGNSLGAFPLQVVEADDDIGHGSPGVVDVILHFYIIAQLSLQPGQGVPQAGIAQMSDVGGLVGVDVGMFNYYLLPLAHLNFPEFFLFHSHSIEEPPGQGDKIQAEVDIARCCNGNCFHIGRRILEQNTLEFFGNVKGVLPQGPCQLQR